jgi:serine/threonine protein kinase
MTAKSTTTSATEVSIFKRIGEAALTDPMAKHVMMLLDNFQHSGPNGTHRCFVFEPMGSTAASMVNKLPENRIKPFHERARYPKWMAKLILKHALLGLVFLHRNNIVHGDLQPGNLLFSISDINSLSEEELKQDQSQQDQSTTPELLERLDGKEDKWAPRYLFLGQSVHKYVNTGPEMLVKISDLGAGRHSPLPLL